MTDRVISSIRMTAAAAIRAAEALLPEWLPEGRRQRQEWIARNHVRGDRTAGSFSVSMDSGKWNDFADSSAHGGDLVSLLAYIRGCGQLEAAKEINQRLGLGLFMAEPKGRPCAVSPHDLLRSVVKKEYANVEANSEKRLEQQEAARHAAELWRNARRASREHPYLIAKGVQPCCLRQTRSGWLLVPLCRNGALINLQRINAGGFKRFLPAGQVSGCYSPIGKVVPGERLYVCEGWATGATLHQYTGHPVACAMTAANLKHVAMALRSKYGHEVEIVIAGDDDRQTQGNPGRQAANAAALSIGASLVFPEWPDGAPLSLTDFNDLHLWMTGLQRAAS